MARCGNLGGFGSNLEMGSLRSTQSQDKKKKKVKITRDMIFDLQASYFAAAFLMPKDEFCQVLRDSNGSLEMVAKHFQVEEHRAESRMLYVCDPSILKCQKCLTKNKLDGILRRYKKIVDVWSNNKTIKEMLNTEI